MAKFNLSAVKALLFSIALLAVVSGSLIFYYNDKVNGLNQEILALDNKLDQVNSVTTRIFKRYSGSAHA